MLVTFNMKKASEPYLIPFPSPSSMIPQHAISVGGPAPNTRSFVMPESDAKRRSVLVFSTLKRETRLTTSPALLSYVDHEAGLRLQVEIERGVSEISTG